jgi:hypothetical protein
MKVKAEMVSQHENACAKHAILNSNCPNKTDKEQMQKMCQPCPKMTLTGRRLLDTNRGPSSAHPQMLVNVNPISIHQPSLPSTFYLP